MINEKNKETVENNVIQWLGLAKKCDTNSGSKIYILVHNVNWKLHFSLYSTYRKSILIGGFRK